MKIGPVLLSAMIASATLLFGQQPFADGEFCNFIIDPPSALKYSHPSISPLDLGGKFQKGFRCGGLVAS